MNILLSYYEDAVYLHHYLCVHTLGYYYLMYRLPQEQSVLVPVATDSTATTTGSTAAVPTLVPIHQPQTITGGPGQGEGGLFNIKRRQN